MVTCATARPAAPRSMVPTLAAVRSLKVTVSSAPVLGAIALPGTPSGFQLAASPQLKVAPPRSHTNGAPWAAFGWGTAAAITPATAAAARRAALRRVTTRTSAPPRIPQTEPHLG
jgi:hypothetical protein